ncbi:NB-ARC domain-containing protein [Aerosakkonemataceae cyanobacterium BLCC-F154]|uniref:NB-ARC domain-containing protein n=1 Tax=Floridaenema fluviatile BLCC-F154 TaxID=3153640 RepID=A0ABV4YHG4_9CYAN
MSPTLKASKSGLAQIQQARNEKGWTVDDPRWLIEASKILSPEQDWSADSCYYAHGCSETTWKRFLRGIAISSSTFKAFCQVLELNWTEVFADDLLTETQSYVVAQKQLNTNQYQDWGDAPDVPIFYGRTEELTKLKHWILNERCRLVTILGMGGMGKTALCVKLAQELQDKFEWMIWRSLRYITPGNDILFNLIPSFSDDKFSPNSPVTNTLKPWQVLEFLRKHRCLIILDNYETILRGGELAGQYIPEYQQYGELIRLVGESNHHSCLVINTRENPQEIAMLSEDYFPVRYLKLNGLKLPEAQDLLQTQGLSPQKESEKLIESYAGNPLALKMVSHTIQILFQGNIWLFLTQGTLVIGDIFSNLLAEHFERLSNLERNIIYCLAIQNKPLSIGELPEHILINVAKSEYIEAMESLCRRCLLEKNIKNEQLVFNLQLVVMKYATKQLVTQVYSEIVDAIKTHSVDRFDVLRNHQLISVDDRYPEIKTLQDNSIIRPIKNKLKTMFKDESRIEYNLHQLLIILSERSANFVQYASKNIEHLL